MAEQIELLGVRVHNLKNIDVSIPTGQLVVITGVSGSGKSSLAFDTLYAEGHRRYVESLSPYARQFLERMERPDVAAVEGLAPGIAIRQRTPTRNPRSTVATATEIHEHLRLLFARVGRTACPSCGETVGRDTADSAADRLLDASASEGIRLVVAFPLQTGGTPIPDLVERLRDRGFRRLLVKGEIVQLESLTRTQEGGEPGGLGAVISVVVDRVTPTESSRSRLAEALEIAFAQGGGEAEAWFPDGRVLRFSERYGCARCGAPFEPPQPRLFSFNNPFGACPTCHGFGNLIELDLGLVIPDPRKSLGQGAIEPWSKPHYAPFLAELKKAARRRRVRWDVPWAEMDEGDRRWVIEGDEDFAGVLGFFRWLEGRKYKVQVRVFLSRYRGYQPCPACQGARLRPEALAVRVGGQRLDALCSLTVEGLRAFLAGLQLDEQERAVAAGVLEELHRRLGYIVEVGLGYLTLDRPFGTLSGGEAQRIALATSLGMGLLGTMYVLDEPSVGLHPRDTERLVGILLALRDQGNSVIVVEHDPGVMKVADHIIDLGPGAGEQGGRIVFQGSYDEMVSDGRSLTGKYLRGELGVTAPVRRRPVNGLSLTIRGARAHNLKGLDVRIPFGALTCVTGVSGSGKSTLVHDVLCGGLLSRLGQWEGEVGAHAALDGASWVQEVVLVDQSPVGRTPRSNPVTYLKAFDGIRDLFAATRGAQERGLTSSHFSFNVPGGRCETCGGDGHVKVDMHFLADISLVCDACGGRRYRRPVLEVRYKGRTIDEVLDFTVHEAVHFFASQPKIARRLKLFERIGLGYLRLGQPATTLSAGEAQRLKLALHLARRSGQRVMFVLDEPTTGLHMADVNDLLACFEQLLEGGATLVVVEHNLDVIRRADWVIDLGPEGGAGGGELMFQGTPEGLAAQTRGATWRYLREALALHGSRRLRA